LALRRYRSAWRSWCSQRWQPGRQKAKLYLELISTEARNTVSPGQAKFGARIVRSKSDP
jgi:hypothetical protein